MTPRRLVDSWFAIGALVALGLVVAAPTSLTVAAVVETGWSGVAVAGFASRVATLAILLAALAGTFVRAYWAAWAARALSVTAIATVAGHLMISGRLRVEDLLWAGLGLILALGGSRLVPRRHGPEAVRIGRRVLCAARGWAGAASLGTAPLVVATATSAVAHRLGIEAGAWSYLVAAIVALLVVGGGLLLSLRDAPGFIVTLLGEGLALYVFHDLFGSSWGAHPSLLVLIPAAVLTAVAASAAVIERRGSAGRATPSSGPASLIVGRTRPPSG